MEAKTLQSVHDEILKWYKTNGRKDLPWRNLKGENAPYGVYVSEIMLQQTQVATVLGKYYEPFLNEFPSLEALKEANEERVLYLWRGLGYYLRARNMLKTARICGKYLPSNPKELIKLPGIGEYTAGAIACFGFGKSVSFVDGNIKRVLSRFFALKSPKNNELQEAAQKILNQQNSFDHNQALLDIGALVCLPLSPKCVICPLQLWCKGWQEPLVYTQKKKITYEVLDLNLGLCVLDGKIALAKSEISLYKGLYNFPRVVETITDEGILSFPFVGEFRHSYTRYRLKVKVYLISDMQYLQERVEFFDFRELDKLPMSSMTLKVFDMIREKKFLDLQLQI
ncbi:A/G-specific adenine glycosylase [Helicobacter cappadocius]|uniref:Adenine DNA glycosylase n=1 Tax=Helicobacter cappadocius TaxID=3063998 RepID=A0AA90PJT2_9HELI|nr:MULTISPECIES: A/G-specific adenine glycosylase [unclassified Helicobacter]MDO7253334.1 A/G-specific adenine glycosylase [Helicobacter sp. faydin-H75]MDP2539236.1 A/G-specific adenine glycosylase [Helicobacter sp. faydin-H76]